MGMKILSQKEEKLFSRKQVTAVFDAISATPSREEVSRELVEKLACPKELLVINSIRQNFGRKQALVEALVYSDRKALDEFERGFKSERGVKKEKKTGEKKG